MIWYYAVEGNQVGPVNDDEFQELINNGGILEDTLVWNETMADWTEYGKISGASESEEQTRPLMLSCSECGNAFSKDDMIRYESSWVCASCKPIFIQKIKEGIKLPGTFDYAGFWIRGAAKIIDSIILGVLNMLLIIPFGLIMEASQDNSIVAAFGIFGLMLIQIGLNVGYVTWFLGKFAATPGKMACRIEVITSEGGRVSYLRAFGRAFAEMISQMILYIGYIIAAFDDQKRALHDHICNTRVIRK